MTWRGLLVIFLRKGIRGFLTKKSVLSLLTLLITILIVCAIYGHNMGDSFVGLDRALYAPILETGKFLETAKLLFWDTKGAIIPGYYAPLSSMSLMVDKWLIGSEIPAPRWTLLLNLLFHCANGILVFLLLRTLGVPRVASHLATFIFLVHPVQVSSVCWFAERKNLMSMSFYLIAYFSYVRFRIGNSPFPYLAAILCFVASCMSKPAVILFPCVLVVNELLGVPADSDAGPKTGQLETPIEHGHPGEKSKARSPARSLETSWRRVTRTTIWPTVPFFVISLCFGLIAIGTEPADYIELPLLHRPFLAASAICFYVSKIVLPIEIVHIYPRWNIDSASFEWWIPIIILIVATILLYRFRKKFGIFFWWGLANFLVALVPVLGIVKFGSLGISFVSNHFLYLPMLGISCSMAVLITGPLERIKRPVRYAVIAAAVSYLAFVAAQTWRQTGMWENSLILWTHTVWKTPSSHTARNMLGIAMLRAGKPAEATRHIERALEIDPTHFETYNNLGEARARLGEMEEAEKLFRKAIEIKPNFVSAYNNLGLLMLASGRVGRAINLFERAIQIKSLRAEPYNNLGAALMKSKRIGEAAESFQKAVSIYPGFARAHANLGFAMMNLGKIAKATEHLKKAVAIDPDLAMPHYILGRTLESAGDFGQAAAEFNSALKVEPEMEAAHYHLANTLVKLRRAAEAIAHYEKAVELNPSNAEALNNLGALYMMSSRLQDAVAVFRKALKLKPDMHEIKRNLEEALRQRDKSSKER